MFTSPAPILAEIHFPLLSVFFVNQAGIIPPGDHSAGAQEITSRSCFGSFAELAKLPLGGHGLRDNFNDETLTPGDASSRLELGGL